MSDLSDDTKVELGKCAVLLAMAKPAVRVDRICKILFENARLLSEVNQHRVTLGMDPHPGYTPKIGER